MSSHPLYLSDLPKNSRVHLEKIIKRLLQDFTQSEVRLRSYLEGEDPYACGSVVKLIFDLNTTSARIDATVNELIAKHGLPEEM